MRIPTGTASAAPSPFEQVLQQSTRVDDRAMATPKPTREAQAESEAPAEPAPRQPEREREPAADPVAEAIEQQSNEPVTHGPVETARPDVTESTSRGETVRQETAGKGADSPRTSARDVEPLLAAVVQRAATPAAVSPVVGGPAIGAVEGARAATTGNAPTRGVDGTAPKTSTALPTPATTGSYKTNSAASAQLLEQSRDSVFKQILMRLDGTGGEMRMRLEPPELGELNLRLVMDHGNKLTLTIAAERQDIAQLLQQHLAALEQTLKSAGLDVAGAEVQTQSEFDRQSREHDAQQAATFAGGGADEPAAPQPTFRPRGFVAAEGLDFWA
ncbi:MAG: flagellar hook-length control protein FliK [Planctomycetes bacterium]|nr:flagellar hook-length control protein FliK [Planctomycetota bacterium]